jgi:hypothetical protein
MRKYRYIVINLLILFLLNSCDSSTKNSLNEFEIEEEISLDFTQFVKVDSININNIFKSVKYIHLKPPTNFELYKFDKIYQSKDFIIVVDIDFNNTISVFDHSGNFKYQIQSGEGPKMIFEFGDVTVDEINNYLYVLSENINAIMKIDMVSLKRSMNHFEDDCYIHKLEFQSPNNLWLYRSFSNYIGNSEEYALTQFNIETKQIVNQYFKKPEELKISFLSTKPLTIFQNTLYYAPSYSNNVIVFEKDKTKKISFVNIPNASTFFGLANYSEFTNRLKDDNLYSFQDSFIGTANNYLFYLSRGLSLFTAVYDKRLDKGYYSSILYDDHLRLPFIPYLSTSSNSLLYVFDEEIIDNYGLHSDTQEVLTDLFPEINSYDQKLILAVYEN